MQQSKRVEQDARNEKLAEWAHDLGVQRPPSYRVQPYPPGGPPGRQRGPGNDVAVWEQGEGLPTNPAWTGGYQATMTGGDSNFPAAMPSTSGLGNFGDMPAASTATSLADFGPGYFRRPTAPHESWQPFGRGGVSAGGRRISGGGSAAGLENGYNNDEFCNNEVGGMSGFTNFNGTDDSRPTMSRSGNLLV